MDIEKVVSGSYDNTLKIWSLKSGECTHTLRGHIAHVLCLQFQSNTLVSGSADKTIKVCYLRAYVLLKLIHICFSNDYLVIGLEFKRISLQRYLVWPSRCCNVYLV
jgi:WD40 repeat protein